MGISIDQQSDSDLTTLTIVGEPNMAEMLRALEWLSQNRTRFIVWDMNEADMSNVSSDQVRLFVNRSVQLGKNRSDGKTAVIAPDDLAFGFARMSSAITESSGANYAFGAFRDLEEALAWFDEQGDAQPG